MRLLAAEISETRAGPGTTQESLDGGARFTVTNKNKTCLRHSGLSQLLDKGFKLTQVATLEHAVGMCSVFSNN